MRKLFALAMVALLSLTVALAVVGCAKKAEEAPAPATEAAAPADSAAMPMDSTAAAPADSAAQQ